MTSEQAISIALGFNMDPDKILGWDVILGDADGHPPTPTYLKLIYDGDPPVNTEVIVVQVMPNEEQ